jgi:hypothetical protein
MPPVTQAWPSVLVAQLAAVVQPHTPPVMQALPLLLVVQSEAVQQLACGMQVVLHTFCPDGQLHEPPVQV